MQEKRGSICVSRNGKEGVDGSSPSEGSSRREIPGNRGFLLPKTAPQSTSALPSLSSSRAPRRRQSACKSAGCASAMGHLLEMEEGRQSSSFPGTRNRWNKRNPSQGSRPESLGTSLGDRSRLVMGMPRVAVGNEAGQPQLDTSSLS